MAQRPFTKTSQLKKKKINAGVQPTFINFKRGHISNKQALYAPHLRYQLLMDTK